MSRRALLEGLALGAGAAAAGAAVWPLAAGALDPLIGAAPPVEAPWIEVAGEKEIRDGTLFKATLRVPVRDGFFTTIVDLGAVWLMRSADGRLAALSATCPHLGCGIGPDAKGGFVCPCHDSRFSADGSYEHGPSPRGMDPLPVRVEQGRVLVQALRFTIGTRERRQI